MAIQSFLTINTMSNIQFSTIKRLNQVKVFNVLSKQTRDKNKVVF